jgi:hypothetical protein
MKKITLLISLLLLSPLSYAGADEPLETYTARLSADDHTNSDGKKLTTVAEIIRQDRANYHKFNLADSEDTADNFFEDAKQRERIPSMLKKGHIDKAVANSILHGTPVVTVSIYKNYIEVYLQ